MYLKTVGPHVSCSYIRVSAVYIAGTYYLKAPGPNTTGETNTCLDVTWDLHTNGKAMESITAAFIILGQTGTCNIRWTWSVFCLLGYIVVQSGENKPSFLVNISPSSSGLKSKPRKKPSLLGSLYMVVSWLAYSSTLEVVCSSETPVNVPNHETTSRTHRLLLPFFLRLLFDHESEDSTFLRNVCKRHYDTGRTLFFFRS